MESATVQHLTSDLFRIDGRQPVRVIRLPADLSGDHAEVVGLQLLAHSGGDALVAVIDLAGVDTLPLLMLGHVVDFARAVHRRGGSVGFAGPTPPVACVLRTTELDTLIPVYTDLADALHDAAR